jgi:hypothetical protein
VRRIFSILVGAFAGLFVAWILPGPLTLFTGLAGLALGLLLGMLLSSILFARSRGGNPKDVAKELMRQAVRPDPGAEERPVHEQLIQINQVFRIDSGLAPAVLDALERLIDRIRNLVSKAIDRSPDSEMTFDLIELGKSHLPRLARNFLALSGADRQKAQPEFVQQLQDLAETVEKAERALDEGRLFDYEAQRDFLKAKFGA